MENKQQWIEQQLALALAPDYLQVVNESDQHNVPPGSESHFKVTIVSPQFKNLGLLERHRAVNAVLSKLRDQGLHALALHTFTPEEWQSKQQKVSDSPPCLGGSANKNQ